MIAHRLLPGILCGLLLGPACWPLLAADSAEPTASNRLTPDELAEGWILLFDGESLFGWRPQSAADWQVVDGAVVVTGGEPGLLCTTSEFADFHLRVDFRHPAETNSGVFLRTLPRPTDPAVDCYELNVANPAVSPFPTGSFVKRRAAQVGDDSADWHTFDVLAEGGHFVVALDGRQVLDYTDPRPLGRGRIGLQFNTGRVEFRNVKLQPRGLASIFNGRDLAGWHAYPNKPAQFRVADEGWIAIENGPGQLESDGRWADFVLQAEVYVDGAGLNSGIFFRSIPGQLTQGYESQIHNGYRDGDRSQPVDCGTGGFYRRQNARRVVADDFRWFRKTLIVSGPHMAAWVDGYQVSDWTDERPPVDNPRQGLRTAAGTLCIQAHDSSTKLRLRGLLIVEMPVR